MTEEEPNREKVYELFERAVKDYICECSQCVSAAVGCPALTLKCLAPICFLEPRSRYLAWVHAVLHWWHGLSRGNRQSEVRLRESRDGRGSPHDQGTDGVGGLQGVWKRHSVHAAGWSAFLPTLEALCIIIYNQTWQTVRRMELLKMLHSRTAVCFQHLKYHKKIDCRHFHIKHKTFTK